VLVREGAARLCDTLAAAPDEAQEVLMAPATIPAEGTVCSGFEVAKVGQLVMVFDNTVRVSPLLLFGCLSSLPVFLAEPAL
jgi:hypothetical protein